MFRFFNAFFDSNNIQWNDGRRGQDGWDRYTRRRKWYRDAELSEPSPTNTPNASDETISGLTEALAKEKVRENDDDADTKSIKSTASKSQRRRWFNGSKGKEQDASQTPPTDGGRASGSNFLNDGSQSSQPISIQNPRKPSHARNGSVATSDSASLRDKEIANSQDHVDRWSTRAAGGTERAEREWGLSDEMNMGLS